MIPEPLLRSSTSQFGIGHLVFSRDNSERRKYWEHDTAEWLCGHRMPPFQRPAVWMLDQKVRFIESAWLGLHLGTYVVNRNDSWPGGKHPHYTDLWLIDGQQRLRAIDEYLDDGFSVFGHLWGDLGRVSQRRFEAVPFAQSIIHEADEAKLRELYDRLNFGGTPHTEEQRAT